MGHVWHPTEAQRSLRATLAAQRYGHDDPTTRLVDGEFVHATFTPDGPGTLRLRWRHDPAPNHACGLEVEAWGPGADRLVAGVPALVGSHDAPGRFAGAPRVVERALAATRTRRIGASGNLYHHLLPTVLAQRITGREAVRQWARLCREIGEPAPGPADAVGDLRLPPAPDALTGRPTWWYHPLGIEQKRARTLVEVGRHSTHLWRWAAGGPAHAASKLALIPGLGPWTIGSILGPALGDPDAVAVGDFHFPHAVAWALAGEPRADDDRMLELLAPYAGQRGRVLAALLTTVGGAPARGPRRRIVPVARL
jgi:3-methyladenine DNA glycosylase/8-oxoguanine DNA glycosylase